MLAFELGWRGVMIDIDKDKIQRARQKFGVNPKVSFEAIAVSPENINALIERHGLSGAIAFFSLDIDSFDYWVLEAMNACRPRIMVLEYNGNFGPDLSLTIARDTDMSDACLANKGGSGVKVMGIALLMAVGVANCAVADVDLVTLPRREGTQLTIYNSEDITMVREHRLLTVKKGINRIQFRQRVSASRRTRQREMVP